MFGPTDKGPLGGRAAAEVDLPRRADEGTRTPDPFIARVGPMSSRASRRAIKGAAVSGVEEAGLGSTESNPNHEERQLDFHPAGPSFALPWICIRVLLGREPSQTHSLGRGPDASSTVHNVCR